MNQSEKITLSTRIRDWRRSFQHLAKLSSLPQAAWFVIARILGLKTIRLRLRGIAHPVKLRLHESDFYVLLQAFGSRECDVSEWIEEPRVIVDAGANVGYTTVFLANLFPKAAVVAIEPEDDNYQVLCENVAPYSLVHTVKAALWHRKTELALSNEGDLSWTFQTHEAGATPSRTIDAVTIPGLVSQYGTIDILKIDIEGAEKSLFSNGADEWLDKVRIIVAEVHNQSCRDAIMNAIKDGDYLQAGKGEKVILINRRFQG